LSSCSCSFSCWLDDCCCGCYCCWTCCSNALCVWGGRKGKTN